GPPLEYGFKYSGGMGTFSSQHKPLAIYSPESGKTFFVFGGTPNPEESHLDIMVSYFDHKTGKVPRPVIVYDKMGVNDPQDNATISIDSRGYVWVFISGRARTRPGLIFRSRLPYSIDTFDEITEGEMVFPQPWWMNDSCFMLMHTKVTRGREIYWTSATDGKTWAPSQKLAGMGGHHQITEVQGNKLASVFSYFPEGNLDKRTNLYYVQTEDFGKNWKTIDNRIITTPVTDIHSEALVKDYESEKKLVFLKDLNFDPDGDPVILALISRNSLPGPSGDPREWMVIHWRDNKWNFSKVCESMHNYDMGSLYIDGNEWRIIAPTQPGPQKNRTGGEIVLWTSVDDGATWVKTKNFTSDSKLNNSYVRRPVNANKDFYAFWTDGNPEQISESRLYFTDKGCNKVWVLPYEMKKDFEKPIRIK
ncbi:MAG: BNR-4 repeat-containing protein, partial [Bacteroidia bacterium]|nr:BNR-4 repeat-containing protein [Bacteroidia bacterium]